METKINLKNYYLILGFTASIFILLIAAIFLYDYKGILNGPLENMFVDCLELNEERKNKGECLEDLAGKAINHKSLQEIEEALGKINDVNHLQWCHEFLHYAGWQLYEQKGNMFDSFSEASGKCDSGMYHGIVEAYIKEKAVSYDPESFANQVVPQACDDMEHQDAPEGLKGYCYHGLGHAFMFITDNDLNQSLKYCDMTKVAGSCHSGVYMENIQMKQVGFSDHPSDSRFNDQDHDFPCKLLDEQYKNTCYYYKGVSNVVRTLGRFGESFADCLKVNSQYQNICFQGVGGDIPGPHWSSRTAGEKCKVALDISRMAYEQCVIGAMGFLVPLNHGDPKEVAEFCDVIESDYKDVCYWAAGQYLKNWLTEGQTLKDKCSYFQDEQAKTQCLKSEGSQI